MATKDSLSNITSPARDVPLNANFKLLADTIDEKELILKEYIDEHDLELQAQITENLDTYVNHIAGLSDKHNAQDILYVGNVAGASNVKQVVDNLNTRIDNIVSYSGSSNQEIVDARNSAIKGTTYSTLDARLEANESDHKYFWVEEKTVLTGATTLTLTNTVQSYMNLRLVDKIYGIEWFEGASLQWTRSGQNILFNDLMPMDLTFRITAI